jgi:beta-lactamase superfamily II metal-dependent hydrolase
VAVFYILLAGWLVFFTRKQIAFMVFLALTGLTVFITVSPQFCEDKTIIVEAHGSKTGTVVITNNADSSCVIVNCPADDTYEIQRFLRQEGINRIKGLILPELTKEKAGGAVKFMELFNDEIRSVMINGESRRTKFVKELKSYCSAKGISLHEFLLNGNGWEFYSGKQRITLIEGKDGNIRAEVSYEN